MKKVLFILFIFHFSLFTLLNAASVEAVVSAHEVVQGNPVQLKIIAEGDNAEFPQINEIDGVPVEGRSQTQHTSLQIINGQSTIAHTTNLILTFTPTKDMQIPSYTVKIDGKEYRTKPLKLKVTKSTAPKSVNDRALALIMKADKREVVVGEPILVTVYFSVRNDIRLADNPQYNRPAFKGFFVKEVQEEKRYLKGDHRITELRYILVPQKEGHYVFEPATAKVALLDTSRRDIFGRYFATTWQPLRSNTFDIEVKPAPQDAELIGRFYIESNIDTTRTKANKPVNLTVTIKGDGSLEDFELPTYEIDGVTVYGDDAEVTTEVIGGKLKSAYVKKFVFIADSDFTIPERSIRTYDPQTGKMQVLTVPTYRIEVENKESGAVKTADSQAHNGEIQTDIEVATPSPSDSLQKSETPPAAPAWWMLLAAFAAGVLSMYGAGKISWRPKASPFKEEEALKLLYGHMSDDPEVEAMVRKLYAKKNGQKDVMIDKKELRAMVEKYSHT